MLFNDKIIKLKNGKKALFRSPIASDALPMMEFLYKCSSETHFILRYPEECTETEAEEAKYLENINNSPTGIMIVCTIDGEIAGNCQLVFNKRIKTRHRASVAIGIIEKYWGIGIGSAMFEEMIELARANGVSQMELEYIEGNERARALYEKMGFVHIGDRPGAIRLKDGTILKEFLMIKEV